MLDCVGDVKGCLVLCLLFQVSGGSEAYFHVPTIMPGARDSVVGYGIMLQGGGSQVRFPKRSLDFSIDLILPAALSPWGGLSL
jgi:hypothetical protein